MAKVKSPLMSFSATGQLAKSLVFSTWKGIDDVRQYVVPANPRSAGQVAQRGLMTDAVALWHSSTRNTDDAAAFNIRASVEANPMSGFNIFCKECIAAYQASEEPTASSTFTVDTNTGGSIAFAVTLITGLTVTYQIGLKATVLGAPVSMTEDGVTGVYEATAAGLTEGVDYYIKFATSTAANKIVSGIYKVRALA